MIPGQIAHVVLPCIVAVSILLMLLRPRGIPEVWWISGGALLLITLRLVPLKSVGQAVAKGSDVYLFLIGMMLLSELAREQGVFDWVASVAVRGANGSCSRLFLLVYSVGTACPSRWAVACTASASPQNFARTRRFPCGDSLAFRTLNCPALTAVRSAHLTQAS